MVRKRDPRLTGDMSSTSRIGITDKLLQPFNAARQARQVLPQLGNVVATPLSIRTSCDERPTAGARHEDTFALQLADRRVHRHLGDAVRLAKVTERGQLRANLELSIPDSSPDVLSDLLVQRARLVSADHASKVTTGALVCVEALTSLIALVHPSVHRGTSARLNQGRHLPMATAPTHADLAAIEAEWPVIAAELDVVEAEIRLAKHPGDVLAQRAHRRAVRALLALLAQPTTSTAGPQPTAA